MTDWKDARQQNSSLLSEWQVYRLVEIETGPWAAFQFLVRERLRERFPSRQSLSQAFPPSAALGRTLRRAQE